MFSIIPAQLSIPKVTNEPLRTNHKPIFIAYPLKPEVPQVDKEHCGTPDTISAKQQAYQEMLHARLAQVDGEGHVARESSYILTLLMQAHSLGRLSLEQIKAEEPFLEPLFEDAHGSVVL